VDVQSADEINVLAEHIVSAILQRLPGRERPLLVALDGGSGAGKSTLAAIVAAAVKATVIGSDDFFVATRRSAEWDALTPAERAVDCIDWRRMRREAIEPLLAGNVASWHPFNYETMLGPAPSTPHLQAPHTVTARPAGVIILDGIYSSRPELSDLIDLSILVDAPVAARYRRHDEREKQDEAEWHARWDPAENWYLTQVRPAGSFDLVVHT
jgi:uridine kinase